MLENLDKCLVIDNLELAYKSYTDDYQAPYPARRASRRRSAKRGKFKQIFPYFHHRDHGTLSYIFRTHELHPDG